MKRDMQLRSREVTIQTLSNLSAHFTAFFSVLDDMFWKNVGKLRYIPKTEGDQDGLFSIYVCYSIIFFFINQQVKFINVLLS